MKEFDVVIVANGLFPTHESPLAILHNAPFVVACDGAVRHVPDSDVVIGDGDSVPVAFHDRLVQIDEQVDNDLTKATCYCLKRGFRHIAYVGCTGLREDHTLGNISLLMRYFREFQVEGVMFTDNGFFTPVKGNHVFCSFPRQQVSVFNAGCTTLTSKGLRWQCYPMQELWQGTLNEALGDTFSIEANGCYLVYQTYLPK